MNTTCSFWDAIVSHPVTRDERKRIALEKGRLNEQRVMIAIKATKPWWYVAGQWANEEDDQRGIDLWIQHKVMGWVPFQVKSSLAGLCSHERQGYWFEKNGGSRVPCVVSNQHKEFSDIVSQLESGFRFERMRGSFSKWRKSFKKMKR